jgi:hypothetical protein
MRKHCRRHPLPSIPRWLRPRLATEQLRDLELVHLVNLDAIARGDADEQTLWQVVGGVMRKRSAQAQHKKNCPECSGEGGGGLPALLRILGSFEPEPPTADDGAPKH